MNFKIGQILIANGTPTAHPPNLDKGSKWRLRKIHTTNTQYPLGVEPLTDSSRSYSTHPSEFYPPSPLIIIRRKK